MKELQNIFIIFLLAVNLITFFIYGMDKWKAKRSRRRISEATLLGLAIAGGSIGAWLGMRVFYHKTLHKKFRYGIPTIIMIQLASLGYIVYKGII